MSRNYVILCEPKRDHIFATDVTLCREIAAIIGSQTQISAHIRRASFVSRFRVRCAGLQGGPLREPPTAPQAAVAGAASPANTSPAISAAASSCIAGMACE